MWEWGIAQNAIMNGGWVLGEKRGGQKTGKMGGGMQLHCIAYHYTCGECKHYVVRRKVILNMYCKIKFKFVQYI